MIKLKNFQTIFSRFFMLIIVCGTAATAHAQKTIFLNPDAALAAIFPNKKTWVWNQADGDLNGDRINDLAMLVVVTSENDQREHQIVVLKGEAGVGYSSLAVSHEYCPAQKFYNLDVIGSSLRVTEVHSVNADNIVTNTLQFRLNNKLAELELIGRENQWGLDQTDSVSGLSVNYLTGTATEYKKIRGRFKSMKSIRFAIKPLVRLNGFDCDKDLVGKPY